MRPMLAALGAAVLVTAGAATIYVAVGATVGAYERPAPPPPVGAFRDGGAPVTDPAIERVLRDELPAFLLHPDERSAARLAAAPAFAAHGDGLRDAWRALVADVAGPSPAVHRARVDVVSDQLAAADLGYYLDADAAAYRVEDVAFVRAGDDRERVLALRRLAPAGTTQPGRLGMVQEELGDPVVLLDAVDAKVAASLIPVLGGRAFPIDDAPAAVEVAAGAAIRRELVTALGPDTETLDRATARGRRLVAASVRHHEAQHGLDEGGRRLAHPAALAAYVGEKRTSPFSVRARYELSAYASQIASDVWLPQVTLWSLGRHAFRRAPIRTEEQVVAVVIFEGLARRLGIPARGPVIHDGLLDRDRLAALGVALAARSTTELRSAAAGLWADLFGSRLPRIVDDP